MSTRDTRQHYRQQRRISLSERFAMVPTSHWLLCETPSFIAAVAGITLVLFAADLMVKR